MSRGRRRAALAALGLVGALALGCGRAGGTAPPVLDTPALQQRVAAAQGHPLLVVFWATWCKPCVEEIPDLVTLHGDREHGVRVLAVSLDYFLSGDSTQQVVADYLRAHPAPLEQVVYSGTQDAIFSAFDLTGSIPYAILYDAQGRVLRRFQGRTEPADVRAALAARPG